MAPRRMIARPGAPLLGRDDALTQVRGVLGALGGGTGACVIVEGPAGIGKTRLLAECAREAEALGVAVAAARAIELDRIAPLTTLLMALRGSQPAVLGSDDMASLDTIATRQGNGFWVVHQLSVQIERYAADRTLLISLDDLQWADELTALALRILVPALRSSPVLWLLASRPVAGRSRTRDVIDWLASEGAQRLALGPLSAEDAVALCTQILGTTPGADVLSLAERAGGNPLLLEELVTAFLRTGRRQSEGEPTAAIGRAGLPGDLVESVDSRLRHLSRMARQVLDAGAVLGRVFTVPVVAGVIGAEPAEVHDAVAELVDEGVLIGTGAEVEFRHDLIRDAVYSRLTDSVKRNLHAESAVVLLARGRPVTEASAHLLYGARKGDATTIALLRRAAEDLASTAPSTAADLMLQVLPLLEDRDRDWPSMVASTVRLLASAGRLREARELGESALRFRLNGETEAAMLLGLAEAFKHAGQDAIAAECTRRALSRPAVPPPLRAQLLATQAHALLTDGDLEGADRAAAEAVEVGTGCEEHSAVVFGTVARSVVAQAQGRIAEAIAQAADAVQMADLAVGEARHRHPRLWLARALSAADRFAEAKAVFELGEREAEESGAMWSLPLWHLFHAELKLAAGDLNDVMVEAESGVTVSEQLTARAMVPSLLSLLCWVAVQRGEIATAEEHLQHARRILLAQEHGHSRETDRLLWAGAVLHDALGEPEAAVELLSPVYAGLPRQALLLTLWPSIGPHLVRLARRLGDRSRAQAAATATRQLADLNPHVASLTGAAAHACGLLWDDLAALRTAVDRYRTSPRRLARASALEDLGQAEHAAGDRERAVLLLDEAHELYATSGARRDAARIEQRLRVLGVRRRSRRTSGRIQEGLQSLTESELRVVALVVEGLTNRAVAKRLFLSPHTVDAYLRHAFSKLGISSRVELTRIVLLQKEGDETHAKP